VTGRLELGDFAGALRDEIEHEMHDAPPVRDLADVFARARAIDETAIPPGLHADVAADHDDAVEERIDPALASFAAALRRDAEDSATARQLVPVAARRRRIGPATVVLTLAAAGLLAFFGLSQLVPELVQRDDPGRPVVESHARETSDAALPYEPVTPPRRDPRPAERAPIEIEPPTAVEPAPAIEPAPPRPSPRRRSLVLDELDEAARQRWAAGDLAGAEALLRKLVARAGRTPRAELAYGDLFALARQRGGPQAQSKVWREYLHRFPRGRYADDARGGLCRLAAEPERDACWRDYLAAHPSGAHARAARRRLGGTE
jgi:hypothetical protein